jgi:FkbM family methyltransferase
MSADLGPSVPYETFAPNLVQHGLMRIGRMIQPGRYERKMAPPLRAAAALKRLSPMPIDVTVPGGIAVEPHPVALERLRCNLALNDPNNVPIEPVALGDHAGEARLNANRRNIGSSSIVFEEGAPNTNLIDERDETLLGLCQKHEVQLIDAVKLDVEGAEDFILFPFSETAPQGLWPRLLLIENSEDTWKQDIRTLLREKGYRREPIPSRNMVFWRETG